MKSLIKSAMWILWLLCFITFLSALFCGMCWLIWQAQKYAWSRVGLGIAAVIAITGWIVLHHKKDERKVPPGMKVWAYDKRGNLKYWERG